MARLKSSTFAGSPSRDVVQDASTFKRWMLNVCADIAGVFDRITGENAETETMIHDGDGRGASLFMPIACQEIQADLVLAGASKAAGDMYIIAVPVFVIEGDVGDFVIEVEVERNGGAARDAFLEVRDTSWAVTESLEGSPEPGGHTVHKWVVPLAAGRQYVLIKRLVEGDESPTSRLIRWRARPKVPGRAANGLGVEGNAVDGNPFPVMTMSTTTGEAYDDNAGADELPLDPVVLTRMNRRLSGIWESLTGGPVPGNNTVSVGSDYDHDRSVFAAEPLLEFPLFVQALGACYVTSDFAVDDGVSPPVQGLVTWAAPYPNAHGGGAAITITSHSMHVPAFPTAGLQAEILLVSDGGTPGNWECRVSTAAGNSSWVAAAALAGGFHRVAINDVVVTPDATNTFTLQMRNSSGSKAAEEIAVLSWGAFYDP